MFGRSARLLAAAVSLAIVALVGGGGAQAASAQTITNQFGTLKVSKVTGATKSGAHFAGHYKLNRFVTRNGRTVAVGKLTGTLTKKNGTKKSVSQTGVRLPVNLSATRKANLGTLPTTQSTTSTAAVSCSVLNLVLGPLDLNLLGLVVHLDRVVLNITAVPGAGALLGNLLCAVAGLLEGTGLPGVTGLTGILTNLLNGILGILRA